MNEKFIFAHKHEMNLVARLSEHLVGHYFHCYISLYNLYIKRLYKICKSSIFSRMQEIVSLNLVYKYVRPS